MRIIACLCLTLLFSVISGKLTAASLFAPDSIRILAIRVEFTEDNSANTTGNGKFDLSQPAGPYQIDPPPHAKAYFEDHLLFLKNYYDKISAGRLLLNGEVFPEADTQAYQLDQPMTYYNPNRTPEENNTGLAFGLRGNDTIGHLNRSVVYLNCRNVQILQ